MGVVAEARRAAFRALTRDTRERLRAIYETNQPPAQSQQALAAMKSEAMQQFRDRYAALRAQWLAAQATPQQLAGLDRWVREANNASFGAQAAYDDLVPAFTALYEREGRDFPRFYEAVRALSRLPQAARHAALQALAPGPA